MSAPIADADVGALAREVAGVRRNVLELKVHGVFLELLGGLAGGGRGRSRPPKAEAIRTLGLVSLMEFVFCLFPNSLAVNLIRHFASEGARATQALVFPFWE